MRCKKCTKLWAIHDKYTAAILKALKTRDDAKAAYNKSCVDCSLAEYVHEKAHISLTEHFMEAHPPEDEET